MLAVSTSSLEGVPSFGTQARRSDAATVRDRISRVPDVGDGLLGRWDAGRVWNVQAR